MHSLILDVRGRQVLDSRGNPTVEVDIITKDHVGSAIVPSGASTGKYEACELRDNKKAYHGKSVLKAVKYINTVIKKELLGKDVLRQSVIDGLLLALDGTKNKAKLGANALLGVSLACCRAAALAKHVPLYEYIAHITDNSPLLPLPFANVINGGKHAESGLPFQEIMIVPTGAKSFSQAAMMVSEVYHTLKAIIKKTYGAQYTLLGDEGGFAPPLEDVEVALDLLLHAIKKCGYTGKIKIAMDPAASEFYHKNTYLDEEYSWEDLEGFYLDLMHKYPIISIEDPFDQEDYTAFASLTKQSKVQIVGDDLTVTNPDRILRAAQEGWCNALLLKINQIGTLTEAFRAARIAKQHGWHVMVSHRSGETEDPFIADLAVGLGCGQIKLGACARGERTAKYNQLLRIEDMLGNKFAKM